MSIVSRLGNIAQDVAIKAPCRAATTASITLAGEQTIDGIAVVDGDRVLVKDQTTASENGIYQASTGNWIRTADASKNTDFIEGTLVLVSEGSLSGGKIYRQTSDDDPVTIDSSAIAFELSVGVGPEGDAGAAATIAVGTVTTLDAGEDATVTNSGTSAAAVFDFGIPQGAAGDGDMSASTYDPNSIAADAFDQDNMVDGTTNKNFTATEKTKLAGIAAGAEVNAVASVNGATGAVVLDADDIADSAATNKFVTAADITKLGNLSGTNTGDQTIPAALSDLTGDADDVTEGTTHLFLTSAERTKLGNTSGTNTGDQTTITGNAGTATALATARNIDGQAFDGSADITVIAPGTHAATGKSTPVDADEFALVDSEASDVLKKITFSELKAALKTYFDTLYTGGGGSGTAGESIGLLLALTKAS